jgi:hypothetical protein
LYKRAKKRKKEGREGKKRGEGKGKKREKIEKSRGARQIPKSAAHFPPTLLMKIFIPCPPTFPLKREGRQAPSSLSVAV